MCKLEFKSLSQFFQSGWYFSKGDVLFVPAGKTHRFVNYEPGLTVWAVFWGAIGGESGT